MLTGDYFFSVPNGRVLYDFRLHYRIFVDVSHFPPPLPWNLVFRSRPLLYDIAKYVSFDQTLNGVQYSHPKR